ncbi:MAG TPA: hypothetical protein VH415_15045 [Nitrososphaeraceae archaeon]|jgi:hypothetical protein
MIVIVLNAGNNLRGVIDQLQHESFWPISPYVIYKMKTENPMGYCNPTVGSPSLILLMAQNYLRVR